MERGHLPETTRNGAFVSYAWYAQVCVSAVSSSFGQMAPFHFGPRLFARNKTFLLGMEKPLRVRSYPLLVWGGTK